MFTKDLKTLAQSIKEEYKNAKPYSHIIIDGLFDPDILKKAIEDFPRSDGLHKNRWRFFNNELEKKQGFIGDSSGLSNNIKKVLNALNSDEFVSFLRDLLDIPTLEKDDTFYGGGLHEITKGGRLGVHVDFSKPSSEVGSLLWRRANCLFYLNEDWEESYEGHLRLYDDNPKKGGKLVKSVLPVFNRLLIFGTTAGSWHGHPVPLNCPPDRRRLSFATYYYSEERGDDPIDHCTIFAK